MSLVDNVLVVQYTELASPSPTRSTA